MQGDTVTPNRAVGTMYEAHFQLTDRPFRLTPQPARRYVEPSQQAALNMLRVALDEGEGFIKVVGEVGLGKTLVCRTLLEELTHPYVTAWLPDPHLSPGTMRQAVARDLGVSLPARATQADIHERLQTALLELAAEGRRPVVLIDEAQALPDATLEAVRLLTNLETESRKLLQVVLFGQPELDRRLGRRGLRQLRQRITFSCRLDALDPSEVRHYVDHQLAVAGASGPLFTDPALRLVARASAGVPRLVNVICHKALLAAWGRGLPRAGWREVRRAVADTESTRQHLWSWRYRPAMQAAAFGLIALGVFLALGLWRGSGV